MGRRARRGRPLRQLVGCLRRGLVTEADAEEVLELLPPALGLSGAGFLGDWSYAGWKRVVGVDPAYGEAYEEVKDQDRSRRVLPEASPGAIWCVRRDAPPEDFRTELFEAFAAHDLRDLALFRLPNAVFGDVVGCFFRHRGLPDFDDDDLLLFQLLLPHLAAALGTRRALAVVGEEGALPMPLGRPRAHVHVCFPGAAVAWTRRARLLRERRLGPLGPRGVRRIERALLAAVRRLDQGGAAASSQRLTGDLRVELANVPPRRGESRRVIVIFVDDAPDATEEEDVGAVTPAEELLSARQRQIARLAARGSSAPEMAACLAVGETTVRHHLRVIYRRLGVSSRAELSALVAPLGGR